MFVMKEFFPEVQKALKHYVYVLIDPRNNKIFYVGKGQNNRVFAHAKDALENSQESDKLNIIKDIEAKGLEVKYYILRHGLSEEEALIVESVFIDFLTFKDFKFVAEISNMVAGHHEKELGIATVREIQQRYSLPLDRQEHKLLCININQTYNSGANIYEATRGNWVLSPKRADEADYVVAEYKGVIIAIFEVNEKGWQKAPCENDADEKTPRYCFEGKQVIDEKITQLYQDKRLPKKSKGSANPIRYLY